MKKQIIYIFISLYCLSINAQNKVVISFNHDVDVTPLVLNSNKFNIWNAKKMLLSRAEFYISEIELKPVTGSNIALTDKYILVDASKPTQEFDMDQWPIDEIAGVVLHLGVPSNVNHLDPTTYLSNHPLAPQNPSMQWGWSGGYRFMAIEGKVDNNNDGTPETAFEFHNLGDNLYKSVELTGCVKAENGTLHIVFNLDYIKLFQNIAMTGTLIQHGSAAINDQMMTNGATQGFIKMQVLTATNDPETNKSNITFNPNPANSWTDVNYPQELGGQNYNLLVSNNSGQAINQYKLSNTGTLRLNTKDLPDGMYLIYIVNDNKKLISKSCLIVNHR